MTENRVFKYNFSRKVLFWGVLQIIVVGLLGYWFYTLYEGGYISAWFASFIGALFALQTLSIPRKVEVTPHKVSIVCVLDLTEINIADIVKIRKVNPRTQRWLLPLMGAYGFFGYYGLFFDLRRFEKVKMYATEWQYFVEIVDIYDERFYISCRERDALIKYVQSQRTKL
ncbi:MAG: PH domain-containing protein [Rikenellaceae bacterium]